MDAIDRANEEAEFTTEMAIANHFAQLEQAGRRIVNGQVVCLDCGNTIPPGRLAALPACFRCIGCQTAHEKELKLL